MANRRRKKNDIEEAKIAGQKALEDAKAGRIQRVESENEVQGFAEIPYLQGGNSNFGEAPSVSIDNSTTIPTVQPIENLLEQNASRNEQRRAERDRRASLPIEKESVSVPMEQIMGSTQGPNVTNGAVDRRGILSENGRKEVDRLSKRIESLQRIPMTGDAAIDEVTQSNNQSEIADLQRQIDSIYETDNSESSANVDRYLDSNRKLSKYEKNEANAIFEEYLANNPKAKELYNTNDAAMSSLLAQRFTPDEAEEYARMITLKNKISRGQSAGLHATESMPFVKGLADKSTQKYGERIGRDLSDYDYSSQLEQTQTQNPLASTLGNMGYQLGSYAAFAPLLEGIPVVGKAAEKVGGLFSNPAVGEAAANIVRGQAADAVLDTLPNEILPDIMEGNWRDLPKDILLNQAGNLAFNVLGEGAGALADRIIPYLRNTDEVADAVKQNELDPATLAKQNEIDVNEKVDNVNRAVDEINNLAEQIPQTNMDPAHELASRYAATYQAFDDYDSMDNIFDADGFIESMADDIANGRSLSKYIDAIEENIDDAPDEEIRANMQSLIDELKRVDETNGNRLTNEEVDALQRGMEQSAAEEAAMNEAIENAANNEAPANRELENRIRQNISEMEMSDEVREAVNDSMKTMDDLLDRIDNAQSVEELNSLMDEAERIGRDTDNLLKDGAQTRLISKDQFDEDTRSFINAINGATIKVPDNMRGEFPDQTLKQLQQRLHFYGEGKNYGVNLRKGSGTPIESLFEDIDNATGHALSGFMESQGYNIDSPEGQLKALIEYADALKANQSSSKVMDYNGGIFDEWEREMVNRAQNKYGELRGLANRENTIPTQPDIEAAQMIEKGSGPKQISKYRTNSMNKLDSVNEGNMPSEDYAYNTFSVEEQRAAGQQRWGSNPNAIKELQAKDIWDEVDARYAQRRWTELMESGSEKDIKEAQKLSRKLSYELREGGRLVQTAAEMDDIAGQLNQAKQMMNQRVDGVYGVGTSEALDNMASKIEIALDDVDLSTKAGRDEASKVMAEMMNRDMRSYAPTNKNMSSKSFKGANKILDDIKSGKIDSVDKLIEKVYKQNGGVTISGKDQKKIYDLLELASTFEKGSREQEKALARAAKIALKGTPSTFGNKIKSILYTNMLGNFKTAISRNAFGNLGFQVLEQARSPIAGLVDRATSLVTKKHSTQGWNLGKTKAYGQGFVKGAKEQIGDIASGIDTGRSGSLGWANALKNNQATWNEAGKTKVGRGLAKVANKAEFYVTNAMELGDRPFFEANYAQRNIELHQLIDKYGKDHVAGLSGVPDELLEDTIDMMSAVHAADSVFQKQGKMSKGLTDLRNGLAELSEGAVGVDLLSTSATPFTMTPGNILEKGIEYSPLGLAKNIIETAKEVKGGNFNQKRFVDELSRTITGIPVLGGAYALAKNGGISEGYSDDADERASQQADGYIEYGLNIGDKTYDTSDIPVFGQFMQAAGAINENGLNPESLGQALDAITMGSVMQGMRKAFGGDLQYSTTGSMIKNLANTVKSAGTQLIPSLVRQTAQTTDEYKRDLGEYGTNQYYLNNIINSIPGLRETLPVKYDAEGQEVLQNQGRSLGNKILENYLLPMAVSEYSPSALTQEATRLKEATDNNAAFVPRASRGDLRGWAEKTEDFDYSEKAFYDYKKNLGDLNKLSAEAVLNTDFYKNLDDDDKVSVLADVYSAMKQVAKYNATGIETDDKLANSYMNADDPVEGLISRLEAKYNPYGIDPDKYEEMRDNNEDFTPYEGYKDAQETYDIKDNASYRQAYASGGVEGLGQEVQYQSALSEYGLSDSKTNRAAWDKAVHASADPVAAIQKVAQNKESALSTGFVKSDGTVNQAAYDKAASVLGDDPTMLSNYASFKSSATEKGNTKAEQYIPMVQAIPGLTYEQKGQYAYLYGGEPTGKSAQTALSYGYDAYFLYRLLQNAPDLNDNGKAHDTGDRIKYLYNLGYGADDNPEIYNLLTDPGMSY